MMAESEDAQVVPLYSRTGYPDRGIALKLPGVHVVGGDSSPAALEPARAKAATMPGMLADYRTLDDLPTSLPAPAFSHAFPLHPLPNPAARANLPAAPPPLLAP